MNYKNAVDILSNCTEAAMREDAKNYLLKFYVKVESLKKASRKLSNDSFNLLADLDESLSYFDAIDNVEMDK
jgi:hypothetical protein